MNVMQYQLLHILTGVLALHVLSAFTRCHVVWSCLCLCKDCQSITDQQLCASAYYLDHDELPRVVQLSLSANLPEVAHACPSRVDQLAELLGRQRIFLHVIEVLDKISQNLIHALLAGSEDFFLIFCSILVIDVGERICSLLICDHLHEGVWVESHPLVLNFVVFLSSFEILPELSLFSLRQFLLDYFVHRILETFTRC